MTAGAAVLFLASLASCDSCEETPCDLDAYLADLAGPDAVKCMDVACAQAAIEEGQPMTFRYEEHPNFVRIFVVRDMSNRADLTGKYYDVEFDSYDPAISIRTCDALRRVPDREEIECVGGRTSADGRGEYVNECSTPACGTPLG